MRLVTKKDFMDFFEKKGVPVIIKTPYMGKIEILYPESHASQMVNAFASLKQHMPVGIFYQKVEVGILMWYWLSFCEWFNK